MVGFGSCDLVRFRVRGSGRGFRAKAQDREGPRRAPRLSMQALVGGWAGGARARGLASRAGWGAHGEGCGWYGRMARSL